MPILVAFDFSKPSRRALEEAAALAPARDNHLVVVHAFEAAPAMPPGAHVDPIARLFLEGQVDEAQRLTDEVLAPLREKGLKVELVARQGSPKDVIQEAIEATQPRLVVVGHHSSGLRLGSIAKWLLDHADVPVLVVPE